MSRKNRGTKSGCNEMLNRYPVSVLEAAAVKLQQKIIERQRANGRNIMHIATAGLPKKGDGKGGGHE